MSNPELLMFYIRSVLDDGIPKVTRVLSLKTLLTVASAQSKLGPVEERNMPGSVT